MQRKERERGKEGEKIRWRERGDEGEKGKGGRRKREGIVDSLMCAWVLWA